MTPAHGLGAKVSVVLLAYDHEPLIESTLRSILAQSVDGYEILVSDEAAKAARLDTTGLERRTLELRGREQAVDAWVQPAISSLATTAA